MIRIMLHNDNSDVLLSFKESKKMIVSYWEFCHGECCGNSVDYRTKEIWFMESHIEHQDNETVFDTVEWIDYIVVFGEVIQV